MEGHDRLWTVQETADVFGVDEKTVRRWMATGRISREAWFLTPGGQYRLRDSAVRALLASQTPGPAVPPTVTPPPAGSGPNPH